MNFLNMIPTRLRALFQKRKLDAEMDEEMRAHVEMRAQANIEEGMAPEEARYAALRQFGHSDGIKEISRDQRGVALLENFVRDLGFGVRMLRKNPGFTAVAVLTLALGIGANTSIFSVVDKLLVRSLPVPEPSRLAVLVQGTRGGWMDSDFNYPLFRDYQRENKVFSRLTALAQQDVGFGTGGATERQRALLVSGNYFTMLGVNAALGRTFAENEGVEVDDAPVIVLSHGLWQRSFGADPQVIGRTVTVNGKPFTVIGVAPREFTGTTRGMVPDLYVPITMYGQLTLNWPGNEHPLATRYFTWHQIMGRLNDGLTLAQAEQAMEGLAQQISVVSPINTATNLVLLPGSQGITTQIQDTKMPLQLLLAAAGLVLLIACANLANLQLARATARERELAIRLALGASRGRVMRELMTESLLLSLLGGAAGLLVAYWLTDALSQYRPLDLSADVSFNLDARVLMFAIASSLATGIIFGLAPAWRSSRPQLVPELKSGCGATEQRNRRWNVRGALVVLQVALSLMVLVSAGLCVRSLKKLQQVDPGFEPSRVVLASFDLGLNSYSGGRAQDFYDRLLERVRALPGVEAASLAHSIPLDGYRGGMSIDRVEGFTPKEREHPSADLNMASSDYFRTLNVRVLAGRGFDGTDSASGLKTVIVNDAFVRRYWPGQNAVGKHLYQNSFNGNPPEVWEVIGVVQSVASRRLQDAPRPMMFRPLSQWPDQSLTLAVRTGLDPAATISLLRELVKSIDATVPVFKVRTLAQQKDGSLALQRMAATMLGGFGVLALLLAALGIYGVLAYSVSRRTREIGVRMALGAQITGVLSLVLKEGMILAAIGIALGSAAAFASTRVLKSFLFGVSATDPLTFVVLPLALAGVALLACLIPARRAAKVDPMVALRHE